MVLMCMEKHWIEAAEEFRMLVLALFTFAGLSIVGFTIVFTLFVAGAAVRCCSVLILALVVMRRSGPPLVCA